MKKTEHSNGDGLIGETGWPRSGKFFSIDSMDLRSLDFVNFLYILTFVVQSPSPRR